MAEEQICIWGWNPALEIWIKIQVDVNGRVVVTT